MAKRKLPSGTVDFHTHILPRVDHGSQSLRNSQAQWKMLTESGFSAVVVTPHFYAHEEASASAFLERRDAAARELMTAVGGAGPSLYLGAEVLVFPGLEDLPQLSSLCIGGSDILLLEMPLGGWSREHIATVNAIAEQGITPLLAHLDRYPLRALDMLYDNPSFLFQVNVSALLGLGAKARYFRRMLRAGAIAALGSDLHGVPREGYDRYLRAYLRVGKQLSVVNDHAADLLSNAVPFQ